MAENGAGRSAQDPASFPRFLRFRWLFAGPRRRAQRIIAAFGVTFDYVCADLEFGAARFQDVGVRYKGNGTFMSSRNTLKRSLKIDLNEFVKGQKLAGMPQINLHNAVRDPSSMNEAIAYRLFRNAGVPAPRTAYAKVFVTVPGEHEKRYFGLYTLVEDIGKPFAEEWFKSERGAILKPVTPSVFSDLGDDWKSYNQTYDPKGTLSNEQKQRIISFAKFVTHTNDAAFAAGLGDFLDLENFARYIVLTVWLCDLDGILGPAKTITFTFIQTRASSSSCRGTRTRRSDNSHAAALPNSERTSAFTNHGRARIAFLNASSK